MDPIKKIDVEPLSEQRWAKIEKSIFVQLEHEQLDRATLPKMVSEPPSRSWRWRPAVALVMAGAMAAAIGALATKTMFTSPVGPAGVASAPSRVVTGSSDSHVALGESDVGVAPESAVLVSGDDEHGIMVVVDRGKVECVVAPRNGRPPFLVQAGDVRVKVVGTHFTVARDKEGGGAHVLVAHGVVEVTSHGQTTTLHDGDSWPAAQATPPATVPVTPTTVTQNDPPAPPARAASPLPRQKSTPRQKTTAMKAPVAAPIAASDAPNAPVAAPQTTPAPLAATPSQAPPSLNLPPPPPAALPPAPAAVPPPPAAPSAQEMYEAAAQLEAQNPDGALGTYRKIAGGSGPWAANALFAAGRLQAHRGRNADATRLLDEYLARFPNGANAADARELLSKVR